MDEERILARERHLMEQIRELDSVELPVEEVDDYQDSDGDENMIGTSYRGGEVSRTLTFDTCLASLHTYLGGNVLVSLSLLVFFVFCIVHLLLFHGSTWDNRC
ncbi:hypothetical protein QQ045_032184 [Rhodiola kirilowii]